MKREHVSQLPLRDQQKNLAGALIDAELPFSVEGSTVALRYTMRMPGYQQALDRINAVQQRLFDDGTMVRGAVNYTRGPFVDKSGDVHEEIEQLVYHFGSEEEFNRFRGQLYPSPIFQGTEK
jgi:hypothetical protein